MRYLCWEHNHCQKNVKAALFITCKHVPAFFFNTTGVMSVQLSYEEALPVTMNAHEKMHINSMACHDDMNKRV